MAPLKTKLIKDIFSVDKTLTRSLYDNFGMTSPDWMSPESHWYVIFDKNTWVGYAAVRGYSTDACYLGPTFIRPEYRGQNLQAKLIKKRLRLAKKLGYTKAISSTYSYNYPSNNNLIKCGFRMVKPWLVQEVDSIYWEKEI